jgi:hypothetical protein
VRRVVIYSDFPLTFTAYLTHRVAKNDPIIDLSEAEWLEYQRIEKQYAEWQQRLERAHDTIIKIRTKQNVKKVGIKDKAG